MPFLIIHVLATTPPANIHTFTRCAVEPRHANHSWVGSLLPVSCSSGTRILFWWVPGGFFHDFFTSSDPARCVPVPFERMTAVTRFKSLSPSKAQLLGHVSHLSRPDVRISRGTDMANGPPYWHPSCRHHYYTSGRYRQNRLIFFIHLHFRYNPSAVRLPHF
jgi:hypothetical protein